MSTATARALAALAFRDRLAALDAQVPAAWVDEFGNAYPLAAYNGSGTWRDAHKRHWRRAYLAPVAPAAAVPVRESCGFTALAKIEHAAQRHVTRECREAVLTEDECRALLEHIDRMASQAPPAAVPARGYVDKDRQRIVSAMQSMRDRLGGFLVNTCGDAFDGDIDTMLEAINFMKALRIDALTAVPARKSPPVPHADHEDCNCVQVGYADGWNACRAAMLAAPAAPPAPAAATQNPKEK